MFSLIDNSQDKNSYNKELGNEKDVWARLEKLNSVFPEYENTQKIARENTVQFSPDFSALDDILNLDMDSSHVRTSKKGDLPVVPSASIGLIQKYTRGIKRLSGSAFDPEPRKILSTEEIIRLAGVKFFQTFSHRFYRSHQFNKTLPVINLSQTEAKDVDIVHKLLSAAAKTDQKKYNLATKYLDQCDSSSSNNGNQIERIVHYISKALREKVGRETGKFSYTVSLKKQAVQVEESFMKARPVILAFYQKIPLYQITLHAGMQVIAERVAGARRVHIIDLDIRSGLHTSVLLQALGDRVKFPIELLKITAVTTKLEWIVKETGKRLSDFAQSMDLPFLFHVVMVPEIRELKKELFEIDPDETVAVTALYSLRTMISRQNELESLMRVIKNINPRVMVVTEIESKLNKPLFVNRFIEALFYYGAFFDCLEDITSRDSQLRIQLESTYLGYGIRNEIVGEGDERTIRHVNLNTWRKFFSQFDIKEEDLSPSVLLQANLVAKTFECWNSCTIYKEEKSLIVGWKGMPLKNVSAWSF